MWWDRGYRIGARPRRLAAGLSLAALAPLWTGILLYEGRPLALVAGALAASLGICGLVLLLTSALRARMLAETDRRQASRYLAMAEQLAQVGHWRVELPAQRLVWSDEIYRIHGLPVAAEAPGIEQAIAAYHPEDRETVRRCIEDAIGQGRDFSFELRVVRPSGEARTVMARGGSERDASGRVVAIVGVFIDATGLKSAEAERLASAARLEKTLEYMDQGLVMVAPNGVVEVHNRRYRELLDLPAALLASPRLRYDDIRAYLLQAGEFAPADPDYRQHVEAREGRIKLDTFERRRPDGSVLEIRTKPLPGGGVVRTYTDVTARRNAETALRASEAGYRLLAEQTGDVITRLTLDFKRDYVSPGCRALFGYEPEEMLGGQPTAGIHPEDAPGVHAAARELAEGRMAEDRVTLSYRARHKRGHWVWVEASITLVRDAAGEPASLVCSLRDVTERQRQAQILKQAKAEAEASAQVKAEFMANMSHELRTPLTGILGIHDLLRTDAALTAEQRRLIGLAQDSGRSLLAIVNDILDFSKIEAGQLMIEAVPFRLRALIEDCRRLAEQSVGDKAIAVSAAVAGSVPDWFVGDPNRLRQVLLNLSTNAIKFTERGTVTIRVEHQSDGGRLRVAVTDTGIGIAEDKLPLLFKRFSQADSSTTRRYGGTGLGLAISKRLVELMGGKIGVESRSGFGSTFWFALPLQEARPAAAAAPAAGAVPARQGRRILLAEDNLINQELISTALRRQGHSVTVVGDGEQAVRAAGGEGFDIILMDMQMPVMDGVAATLAVRGMERERGRPATPIVALTANAMAAEVEHCRAAGMSAHIAKPVDWPHLLDTIDRLCEVVPAAP